MRKFLRAHGLQFMRMGQALADARREGGRVFVLAEPPLAGIEGVIADEYLTHLPALPLDLSHPRPPSVDPDGSDEVPSSPREAAAQQAGRHLHRGDVLLAFLQAGTDRATLRVLDAVRERGAKAVVVTGLGGKAAARKRSKLVLALPTRGVKTICESAFVCARLLARISRTACRDQGLAEDAGLVQVTCEMCNERVFFEARLRGRRATCALCEATVTVPRDSGRGTLRVVGEADAEEVVGPKRRRRLKPSVLEVPTLQAADLEDAFDSTQPALDPAPEAGAPRGLISGDEATPTATGSLAGPRFGSDIVIGSDVVSVRDDEREREAGSPSATASADPFALEDAFLADLEMPPARRGGASSTSEPERDDGPSQRLVSARYTVADCRLRWGRGGYPDEESPPHQLLSLARQRLEFLLDPDDPAGTTLQQDDELYLRIEIPAFIEPILVRGILARISGASGTEEGARVLLELRDAEPAVRRKLDRAAENLRAPA